MKRKQLFTKTFQPLGKLLQHAGYKGARAALSLSGSSVLLMCYYHSDLHENFKIVRIIVAFLQT